MFDFETRQDSVFQCENGYLKRDSTSGLSCTACKDDYECPACRTCVNCSSSSCNRNYHVPNYVVSQSACDTCKDDILTEESKCFDCGNLCPSCQNLKSKNLPTTGQCLNSWCGNREVIFKGDDTVFEFCSWLISPLHKNYVAIAHNGKGFDFSFILNFCVREARIKPQCVVAGSKIMCMDIKDNINLRFIDSLNFMGMSLKNFPKLLI